MKMIEERAMRYATIQCKGCRNEEKRGRYLGYIQGAAEQKAIDDKRIEELEVELAQTSCYEEGLEEGYAAAKKAIIEKACKWMKGNLGYYNRNEVHIGKSYEQCVIDDFCKAMEE